MNQSSERSSMGNTSKESGRDLQRAADEGRRVSRTWLADMLAIPRYEYPEFPTALSFVMVFGPDQTLHLLEQRSDVLRSRLAQLDQYGDDLSRVSLLEDEYLRALAVTEMAWLDRALNDLSSGSLVSSAEVFDLSEFEVPAP